jgi:DNA-binding LacI/PurR family transcriptional regulator/serine phosphatase RsbU (regulator of sigma subunit)
VFFNLVEECFLFYTLSVKHKKQSKQNIFRKSPTIAFMGDKLNFDIPISFFRAVKEVVSRNDINMLYCTGKPIRSPFNYDIQANILYDLVGEHNIDGLIIASNLLSSYVPHQELIDLCRRYNPLPIVSIGAVIEGIPSVVNDNFQGMYDAVSHLIEVHARTHIAYLMGPEEHPEVQTRFKGYTRAMKDHDLVPDSELIIPGNFRTYSGHKAISVLLDEKHRQPGRNFDAIVCTNDYMAFGVITELQTRGIRVPEDIAVTGFDDVYITKYYSPALSTVHQFFDKMGWQATELLLALIDGKEIPAVTKVPAKYLQRQSCGCKDTNISETEQMKDLPAEVSRALTSNPRQFIQYLSQQIYNSGLPRNELSIWDQVYTLLNQPERWCWKAPGDEQGDTFGQYAWAAMGKTSYLMFDNVNDTLSTLFMGMDLISTLDIPELMNILVNQLPKFRIRRCYLSLYENPPLFTYPQTPPEWARLILAYDENERMNLPPDGLVFPTRNLVPREFINQEDRIRMVMESLYFKDEQIGFWLMEADAMNEKVYPTLSSLISSSLQGALILKRLQERTQEVAIANKEIQVLNRQLKDENFRIRTEMEVARHIQISLLPEEIKTIHPDFDITARMLTAAEVGGDYYDISLDREGKLWLGIGDVSGHGVTSGLIMMMAQTVHTTITTNYNASPRDIVVMINNVLFKNIYGRMGETRYMTFTTLKYLGEGRFQYAGLHLDLLIYRQHSGTCELLETRGLWLNVSPDIDEYTKNDEFYLGVGDVLILFTDGLTEVFNKQNKLLDIEGFKDIVTSHGVKEVETMQDAIFNDVTTWCYGEPKDDMSLVVLRRIK